LDSGACQSTVIAKGSALQAVDGHGGGHEHWDMCFTIYNGSRNNSLRRDEDIRASKSADFQISVDAGVDTRGDVDGWVRLYKHGESGFEEVDDAEMGGGFIT
jgi:hypothetical protein